MADADRTRLRATFDEAAERYDRARPGYPRWCSMTSPSWPASAQAAACWRSAAGRGRRPCRWLFDCIADLIERRHGGRITKRYLTELQVAHAEG